MLDLLFSGEAAFVVSLLLSLYIVFPAWNSYEVVMEAEQELLAEVDKELSKQLSRIPALQEETKALEAENRALEEQI